MSWGGGRFSSRVDPVELHESLAQRLKMLDTLMPRLSHPGCHAGSIEISSRELMQARSQTALSSRLYGRLLSAPPPPKWHEPSRPCELFFEKPELLEHMLSFVETASELAQAGAVCTSWYLASRMQSLWEGQLRRSGRLVGPSSEALPMPHEEECTLFETAARIERHGCRPIAEAELPEIGTIDSHVDDFAAYEIKGELNENTGTLQPVGDASSVLVRSAVYVASHASRGCVSIRTLNASQAHWLLCSMQVGKPMPRATSPHLQPVLQIILSNVSAPALVQPAFDSTLDLLLKRAALPLPHAHQIFCQLAHGLQAIHEQGFFHGHVLVSSVVLRQHERAPFALLDKLVGCRCIAAAAKRGRASSAAGSSSGWAQPSPTPASPTAGDAEEAPAAVVAPTMDPLAPAPVVLPAMDPLEQHAPLLPSEARPAAAYGYGRSFEDLLTWAWSTYDRLGTLTSAHFDRLHNTLTGAHGAQPHQLDGSEDFSVPESYLSADICDLGRLLLRLLLQPYKMQAQAQHPGNPAAMAMARPPPSSVFPESLQRLLRLMLHPQPRARPSAAEVLRSEWVRQLDSETPRPLCCCWRLADAAVVNATPSDLRLLRRPLPPFSQVSLAGSPAVTDEWLEALATYHAASLTRLDLSGCTGLSSSTRPLRSIMLMQGLQALRLPRELWAEHEIADCLVHLPNLCSIDDHTYEDLLKARDALKTQCDILCNVKMASGRR